MRPALVLCCFILAAAGTGALAQAVSKPATPIEIIDPIRSWLKGDNGTVTLTVHITREGRVDRILQNSASKQLRPMYEHFAQQWRFDPATENGRPVESTRTLRFRYVITSNYELIPNP